jgi:ABC-type sugar transport system substrate-binding protein
LGGIAVVLGLALALSACGAGEQGGGQSGEALEIGIVTFSATDVAVSDMVKGAQERATEIGYTTTLVDANGSVDAANSAIQNLVQKQSDAILVTIFPATALSTGLAAAKEAGIPIVLLGGGEGDGVSYESDDVLAKPLSEKMLADVPDGADILALNYRGGRPCQLREAGFDEVTAAAGNLNIEKQETPVPGQMEASRAATLAWLTKTTVTPGKTVVWTCFDDQALGVVAALKEQGLNPGDVWVYSVNGTVDALNAVKDGWMKTDLWIDHYGAGKEMIDVVAEIRAAGDSWQFKSVPAPYELVSADNYDQFKSEHPDLGIK